ncbi:serine hydrolase domain-containing protein [Marispirochaeta aestuarii]|uniref:serine hydrolase domain-containing protein n=1 Tax=Marispirochaeta aestuarii TaxID=1963862 RepID=UPI0029C99953|nr:serine hydrolase domain-containing protein [Marispirochaeta aestuarii]
MKERLQGFLHRKIEEGLFPGAQLLVGHKGRILTDLNMGSMLKGSRDPKDAVTENTLFNIESITKVMVTLPIVFKLMEEGELRLDDCLVRYLPEFGTTAQKKKVRIRDLLNFSGGIPMDNPAGCEEAALKGDLEKSWKFHYSQDLVHPPGTKILYSDVSCRILGKALEKLMGKSLAAAASEWFFTPLGMKNTTFTPKNRESCAATGVSDRGRSLRGEICQDLEHALGEVLGSDGLFSNAHDMFVFSQMLLEKGIHNTHRFFSDPSLERMTRGVSNAGLFQEPSSYLQYIVGGPKTWFWEYARSPFSFFGDLVSDSAIGKMGGAGTFLLIDPTYDLVIVYLTNYGQPERSLEGDEGWNTFFRDIDVMGLCNMVLGKLV